MEGSLLLRASRHGSCPARGWGAHTQQSTYRRPRADRGRRAMGIRDALDWNARRKGSLPSTAPGAHVNFAAVDAGATPVESAGLASRSGSHVRQRGLQQQPVFGSSSLLRHRVRFVHRTCGPHRRSSGQPKPQPPVMLKSGAPTFDRSNPVAERLFEESDLNPILDLHCGDHSPIDREIRLASKNKCRSAVGVVDLCADAESVAQ